jgi:hypothetical protein
MAQNEQSLERQFVECEKIVEDLLKDRLGESNDPKRNVKSLISLNLQQLIKEKLKHCVEQLQQLSRDIERLALFSSNDQVEELPTSSLRFLLVPAYLAYVLQEIPVEVERRRAYLIAAKVC